MKGLTVTVGDAGNTCVSCKLHVRGGRKRCNDVRLDHPCRVHNVFTPRGLLPFLLDADDRRWLASNFSRLIAPTHCLYVVWMCNATLLLLCDCPFRRSMLSATQFVDRRANARRCLSLEQMGLDGSVQSAYASLSLYKLLARKTVYVHDVCPRTSVLQRTIAANFR